MTNHAFYLSCLSVHSFWHTSVTHLYFYSILQLAQSAKPYWLVLILIQTDARGSTVNLNLHMLWMSADGLLHKIFWKITRTLAVFLLLFFCPHSIHLCNLHSSVWLPKSTHVLDPQISHTSLLLTIKAISFSSNSLNFPLHLPTIAMLLQYQDFIFQIYSFVFLMLFRLHSPVSNTLPVAHK